MPDEKPKESLKAPAEEPKPEVIKPQMHTKPQIAPDGHVNLSQEDIDART